MRVLDSCNTIVASSLEQTTWLRKNLQVRVAQPDAQSMKSGSVSNPLAPVGTNSSNETSHLPTDDSADFDGKLLWTVLRDGNPSIELAFQTMI